MDYQRIKERIENLPPVATEDTAYEAAKLYLEVVAAKSKWEELRVQVFTKAELLFEALTKATGQIEWKWPGDLGVYMPKSKGGKIDIERDDARWQKMSILDTEIADARIRVQEAQQALDKARFDLEQAKQAEETMMLDRGFARHVRRLTATKFSIRSI